MSKQKFQLLDATNNFSARRRTVIERKDWEQCLICQCESSDKLACPASLNVKISMLDTKVLLIKLLLALN